TEQERAGGCGQPDRTGTGDVDGGTDAHPGAHATVEPGGEDVGEHRQVQHLLQRLVLVRELQRVEVRVRHQHVLGLSADPAAHVHVPVGAAVTVRVDVQADSGLALLAVLAAPTGDVERHGDDVTDLERLHVRSELDHLAGDLVAEDEVHWCGGAATDHVLVGPADVGGDRLQDHPVRHLPPDVGRVDA